MGLLHGLLNLTGFLFMVGAIFFARKHKRKLHHLFLLISFILLSSALILMLIYVGGILGLHCITGVVVFVLLLFVILSGFLFSSKKLKRRTHKVFGIIVGLLLLFQILYGFLKSLLL